MRDYFSLSRKNYVLFKVEHIIIILLSEFGIIALKINKKTLAKVFLTVIALQSWNNIFIETSKWMNKKRNTRISNSFSWIFLKLHSWILYCSMARGDQYDNSKLYELTSSNKILFNKSCSNRIYRGEIIFKS